MGKTKQTYGVPDCLLNNAPNIDWLVVCLQFES